MAKKWHSLVILEKSILPDNASACKQYPIELLNILIYQKGIYFFTIFHTLSLSLTHTTYSLITASADYVNLQQSGDILC